MHIIPDNHLINLNSLGNNPIFVDVGACYGMCVDWAIQHIKKPRIFAIEPCVSHIKILKKFKDIQIYWAALVGNDFNENEVQFNEFVGLPKWGQIAELDAERAKSAATYKKLQKIDKYNVPVIKIKELLQKLGIEKIDYLKMDIEGTEKDIVKDIDSVSPFIHQMSMEVHFDPKSIIAKLTTLGYKVTVVKNEVHAIR